MAICDKSGLVKKVCQLYEQCSRLEGLPPCALVAAHSTSDNTTNNAIAFVKWVAGLSKTEYAAHRQLVHVIDKANAVIAQQH